MRQIDWWLPLPAGRIVLPAVVAVPESDVAHLRELGVFVGDGDATEFHGVTEGPDHLVHQHATNGLGCWFSATRRASRTRRVRSAGEAAACTRSGPSRRS